MKNCPPIASLQELESYLMSDSVKVISFDVFDTLLLRPCDPMTMDRLQAKHFNMPTDVYRRTRMWGGWWKEVDSETQKLIGSNETRMQYRRYEMDLEESVIRPRRCLLQMFNRLTAAGREVVLTTDMHLPIEFIDHLLILNGFRGYKKIYLSRNGKAKGNGKLFEELINDYSPQGILPDQIIHLGDNRGSDVEMPLKYGMQSLYIPSPSAVFKSTALGEAVVPYSDGDRVISGYLSNILCDDPFQDYSGYSDGSMCNLGVLLGVHFTAFVNWMTKDASYNGIEKILLVMSDGHLLSKMLDIFKEYVQIPQYEKVQLGRVLRGPKMVLSDGITGDPAQLKYYVKPFFFKNPDSPRLKEILDVQTLERLPSKNTLYLNQNLDKEKLWEMSTIFDEYLESFLKGADRIAIFDSSYHATAMKYLREYMPDYSDKIVCEYQLTGSPEGPDVKNYIETKNLHRNQNTIDLDLCVKDSSAKVFRIFKTDNGYGEYAPLLERLNASSEFLQEVICDTCRDFLNVTKDIIGILDFSKHLIWNPITFMWEEQKDADMPVIQAYRTGSIVPKDAEKALQTFERMYAEGSGTCAYYISRLYQAGTGVPVDRNLSREWMEKAYASGVRSARFKLFDMLFETNDPKDYPLMKELAENPEPDLFRMGRLYQRGIGVPKDPLTAIKYLEESLLDYNVGRSHVLFDYLWSLNLPEYNGKMLDYIEKGCMRNNPESLIRKAKYLSIKSGVAHDYLTAFNLLKKADTSSPRNVKRVLKEILNSSKVNSDLIDKFTESFSVLPVDEWIREATALEIPPAIFASAEMMITSKTKDEFVCTILKKIADSGNSEAEKYLHKIAIATDSEYSKNLNDSIKLYDSSCKSGNYDGINDILKDLRTYAEFGNTEAAARLGQAYHKGLGGPIDLESSAIWFRTVKKELPWARSELFDVLWAIGTDSSLKEMIALTDEFSDDPSIMQRLGRAYREGVGVKKDYTKAYKCMKKANALKPWWVGEYMDLLWNLGSEESLKDLFSIASDYADRGDGAAMARLGYMYSRGKGVDKDYSKAKFWLVQSKDKSIKWAEKELNAVELLLNGKTGSTSSGTE